MADGGCGLGLADRERWWLRAGTGIDVLWLRAGTGNDGLWLRAGKWERQTVAAGWEVGEKDVAAGWEMGEKDGGCGLGSGNGERWLRAGKWERRMVAAGCQVGTADGGCGLLAAGWDWDWDWERLNESKTARGTNLTSKFEIGYYCVRSNLGVGTAPVMDSNHGLSVFRMLADIKEEVDGAM
ncbi:hypothetical protein O6P43_009381 [Quillaja saponaria]|uniref:Uncharacterized protein n=1 Tax=Quillaja saponaria TaxID=32244 RepID=A0AAD7VCT7_QUISA|nr:hypothetical protein O6P43_009381 [Quillaja saponaria]